MTPFQAAAIYVAIGILMSLFLTLRVIAYRRKNLISLGDNGEFALQQRIRTHGNYVETMSFALIGLLALAALNANTTLIHILGVLLIVGRALHAYAMGQKNAYSVLRPVGMLTTMLVLVVEVIGLLYLAFN